MVAWSLHEHEVLDSTQTSGMEMASKGAEEGTVVVARTQTSGTGRFGRVWQSPRGGLYMSMVLKPGGLPRLQELSLVASVAAVDGIRQVSGLQPSIRWPNDVMIRNRKLAGVKADGLAEGGRMLYVVVGVGVNCNAIVVFDPGQEQATSLSEELGTSVNLADVRDSILRAMSDLYSDWRSGVPMLPLWTQRVSTLGKHVSIKLKTEENPFSCVAVGIEPSGNLVLEEGARVTSVSAEDVERLIVLS